MKIKLKKGDTVQVLSGKDKGKNGTVLSVDPENNKAIVEGVNVRIKHTRPKQQGQKGQRVQFPSPLTIAKLAIVCPKCKKAVRIGWERLEDGKKMRRCTACKETFK